MSESVATQGADDFSQGAAPSAGGPSAGALLAQWRGAAGVHIEALAVTLKVPVSKLEALEADQYDAFPDAVFMRALASSVCRALKADPAPVLALLPHGEPVQLKVDRGINASFKDQGHRSGKGASIERPKSRMLGVAVVALLVAALAIAFLPKSIDGQGEQVVSNRVEVPLVPAEPAAQEPSAVSAPRDGAPAAAVSAEPSAPAANAPEVSAPAAPVEAVASDAPVAEGVLVIRARAESWVQVRGASGEVVLQKSLAAGESVSAAGAPPWAVVVGRADATDVIVRGKPMDLKAIARENVARFEVK